MANKEPELFRLILLGNVGVGKSTTGNFILDAEPFETNENWHPVTLRTSSSSGCLGFDERKVIVVDTPGFSNITVPMLQTPLEIHKSLDHVRPGPHAFLLVIKCGRISEETAYILELLSMIFGPNVSNYMIIIFTHEDQVTNLEAFKRTLMENKTMNKIIHACSGRHITLNNLENDPVTRKEKLQQLLKLVNEVSNNGTNPYDIRSDITRNVIERHSIECDERHLTGEHIRYRLNEVEEETKKRRQEEEKRRHEEKRRQQEEEKRRHEKMKQRQERLPMGEVQRPTLLKKLVIAGVAVAALVGAVALLPNPAPEAHVKAAKNVVKEVACAVKL